MRMGMHVIASLALAACYGEPSGEPACAITCDESCPDNMACVHGYCVGADQTCEPTFRATSAGTGFGCALDTQDLLWCWGANTYHQLDNGDVDLVLRATQIGNQRWDSITTGGGHLCGLRDHHLYCWGRNDSGQVSDRIAGDVTEPFEIEPPEPGTQWTFVTAGYNDTCAIADGTLYCWGAGDSGQLGNGSTQSIGTPTAVKTELADWTFVDSNSGRYYGGTPTWAHSCAISQSAGLYCWGRNTYGELGDGTQTNSDVPVHVEGLPSPATSVAVSEWSTCAITESQQLYCWGNATYDALGDPLIVEPALGTASITTKPILGSDMTGFTKLDASEWLACALRGTETWCWGWTNAGGLGNGLFTGQGFGKVADGASDLAVGWNANIDEEGIDSYDLDLGCIIVDGDVQCWGDNRYGQLGQGGATMRAKPSEVAGDHRFSSIAAGSSHACGIENGNLLCWGSTTFGQANGIVAGSSDVPCGSAPGLVCNVPAPTQVTFAPTADEISAGMNHSCARSGSSVTCWGDNERSQLGSAGDSPIKLAPALDKLVDVGTDGQCAKQGTQTWCWGAVLGTPTAAQRIAALDPMTSIGVSGYVGASNYYGFGCALDAANKLVCFGDNTLGQYGNGYSDGGVSCGNAICDAAETTTTCALDCGTAPLAKLGRTYTAISVSRPTIYEGPGYTYNITPFVCGIRPDTQVECWGYAYRGAVGAALINYTPQIVEGLSNCTQLTTSSLDTCALCDGDIYCWGDHRFGQVGAGPITGIAITAPRKIDLARNESWAQLVSGASFTCARTESGRTYCWGYSRDGALGSGGASSPLPVTVQLAP